MRQRASYRILFTVLAGVLLATAGSIAHADGHGDGPILGGVEDDDGTPGVEVVDHGGSTGNDGGNDPVYTVPGPYYQYYYTPACSVNGPPGQGADALCMAATSTCTQEQDGPATVLRFFVYRMLMNPDGSEAGDWESMGSQCRGPDDEPEGGPEVITEADIRAAVEGVVPVPSVTVEPAGGTYVNVPTNFVSEGSDQTTTVQVLGVPVQVQFTATDTRWSFGDGTSGTGNGIRNASVGQAGAVEHDYRRAGTYTVTVTRTYSVTLSLPDGQSSSLDGFTRTSPGLSLPVGEVQSLVTEID